MFDTEPLPGTEPSASLVDLDPNAPLFSLNEPGSGSLNAGKVVQQSTSNRVNTYYTNDDLIVQPNGQEFWYDLGTGMPVGSVTTTATSLPMQTATGQYVAEYYNNNSLSGNPTFTRTESSINNDWGADGPGQGIGNDNFSARWTGSFNFDSGHYLFRASMDDGMRMWVDDNLVIDTWNGRNAVDYSAHQFLSSGEHKVKVEYREDTDLAIAKVRWENLSIDTTVANDDNVVAARDSNGQLRIFAIGADQDVWQWRESDNNMTWWHKMGLSATELDVTHAADGSLRVFGIGTDQDVWQWRESDNNMTWWHKMGLSSTEVVVSHATDGSLRVFGIGTDDNAWQWRESDNNMTWWHKMGLSSTEVVVSHAADGSLRVFGIGTDDNAWQWRESDNNMTWWHKMGLIIKDLSEPSSDSNTDSTTYQLPYPDGDRYSVTAGNDGHHRDPANALYNQYAWDFGMSEGSEVGATRGGTVISLYEGSQTNINPRYQFLPNDWYRYTNYVVIDHGDGTSSLYAHLKFNSVLPNVGDRVSQNQLIAQSGDTGYSDGPHLHYSVQKTPAGIDYGNRSGGYWTESLSSSFTDPDVLRQNPDGVPTTGNSYTS